MFIKDIYLVAFGKFHDKRISLSSGLNLVYGGNESGKTTMHKFIEGMFFGFFKPYSKNKIYTPEQLKYTPWSGSDYKGTMVYEKNNRQYRLERSFAKNNEYVRLYDDYTGTDLTDTLDYDSSYKLPKANKHIPVNNVLFKNTVSIGQLSNITDQDLVREIGDLFVDTSGTHSSGVSLKDAIDRLEKLKSKIGTKNQTRSPLGIATAALKTLEIEKSKSEEISALNKKRYIELRKTEGAIARLNTQKSQIQEQREHSKLGMARTKYERWQNLLDESQNLEQGLANSTMIDETLASEFDKTNAAIDFTNRTLVNMSVQKEHLERQVNSASAQLNEINQNVKNIPIEEMVEDKTVLESTIKKLENITAERESIEDSSIEKKYESVRKLQRLFSVFGTISAMIAVISIILHFPTDQRNLLYVAIGFALLGTVLLAMWAITNRKRKQVEEEFERYDTIYSRYANMAIVCEIDIEQFKKKYGCKNLTELEDLLSNTQMITSKIYELEKQETVYSSSLAELNERIAQLNQDLENLKTNADSYLEKAGVKTLEEFTTSTLAMREQAVFRARLEANKEQLNALLSGIDIEVMESEAKQAISLGISPSSIESSGADEAIDRSNDELLQLTSEAAALRAAINEAESSVRPLNEIVEEIVQVKTKLNDYETELKAYSLAIEKINSLSQDISESFAEAFNSYVSAMISEITKGKYTRVLVNDRIQIKVEDKELDQFVDVSSLSGGTIDQLYFCVRFAIMDLIIKDKQIPVFLDDCMLQYDDARLGNILNLICEKAKDRQIILFSCRNAERLLLDSKGYPYNFVNLSSPQLVTAQ
ncbi:MAG: AAA family ATPase [Eubacteriaceae bacterium]|nr:AAA family ATPase [Eubacteriaceae bacterium]